MGNDSSKSTIPTVRIRSTGSSGSIRRPAAAELTADDPKRQLTASLEQLNKRRAELLRSRSASTSSQVCTIVGGGTARKVCKCVHLEGIAQRAINDLGDDSEVGRDNPPT